MNQNAQAEKDPLRQIVLRVPESRRSAYMRASRSRRMTLQAWILEGRDEAARETEPTPSPAKKTSPPHP